MCVEVIWVCVEQIWVHAECCECELSTYACVLSAVGVLSTYGCVLSAMANGSRKSILWIHVFLIYIHMNQL